MGAKAADALGGAVERDRADLEFTAWVAAHRPRLLRAAYLLCGDSFVAEDLVQTCLTRLYLVWPRVARMDAPLAYARRALVNAHIDLHRRPWWSRERLVLSGYPNGTAVVEDVSLAVGAREVVVSALLALPLGQRRVVVLRYLYQLTVRETAAELGISDGTVKSQTSEALRRLAVLLAAADQPEG